MFTKEQLKIIENDSRHSIVVANAGTGKTTCMIAKLKYLIEKEHFNPSRILMTSFSKVASNELIDKAKEVLGNKAHAIHISTIHAIAYKIVSDNLDKLNLPRINIVPEKYLSMWIFNRDKQSYTSFYDNDAKGIKLCDKDVSNWRQSLIEKIPISINKELKELFENCQEEMEKTGTILFDDLLIKTIYLFDKFEDVVDTWINKFDIIIGDEIQDTNKIQFEILECLIGEKTRTCIVGDVKQNIYAFRGAHYRNMENFRKKYNSEILYLSETFRFNKDFAKLSNNIINGLDINDIYKKYTKTNVKYEGKPEYYIGDNFNRLDHILNDIKEKKKNGFNYSDLNIIYRYNKDANDFIKLFRKEKIPYTVKTGDIFDKAEIKFVINALILVDYFSVENCISFFKFYADFVGEETIKKIFAELSTKSSIIDIMDFLERSNNSKLQGVGSTKKKSLNRMFDRFKELTEYLDLNNDKINIFYVTDILHIDETKFMKKMKNTEGVDLEEEIMNNILLFADLYNEYESNDLLKWYNESLVNVDGSSKQKIDGVQLKTIHGCKGQTLPVVYFIADNMFAPYFIQDEEDIKNEMFVLYVAITRAEKFLKIYLKKRKFNMDIIIPDNIIDYNEADYDPDKAVIIEDKKVDLKSAGLKAKPPKDYSCLLTSLVVLRETQKAVLFSYENQTQWFPLSFLKKKDNFYFVATWLITKNNLEDWVY